MEKELIKAIEEKLHLDVSRLHLRIDEDKIAYLSGQVEKWEDVVNIGFLVAKEKKIRNVVNDLQPSKSKIEKVDRSKGRMEGEQIGVIGTYDVVIIGAGITGCGIARELSKYDLKIAVVEKDSDVSEGASKANDGMVHPGNAVKPHTLKAKLNIKGNKLYSKWAEELNFEFHRTGSLILSYSWKDRKPLFLAYIAGRLNRVPKMRLISGKKAMKIEPGIIHKPKLALWTPTTAYVDGFEVTIALAENAAMNGVKFYLESEVCHFQMEGQQITGVVTNKGILACDCVINAAGVYADDIAAMAKDRFFTIHPRKGTILILDKNVKGPDINIAVSRKLNRNTKGGGALRTVSGNPLWGPSAEEIMDKEDISVDEKGFDYAYFVGKQGYPLATKKDVISYFTGVRAPDYKEDFIIEESRKTKGLIHAAAIQSPGLASSPAIANMVVDLTLNLYKKKGMAVTKKKDYNPIRPPMVKFNKLSKEEQHQLIKKDPRYGNVICRCETITEGDIVEALHRPLPCVTIDGIKKRTRATAGRCQGGFCSPKLLNIMARELGKDIKDITHKGHHSFVIIRNARIPKKKEAALNDQEEI